VATAVVGYFILQAIHPEVNPILPVLSYLAVGYIVAKLYMNVFGLAVDTMLQCFIATEEMGGDTDFVPGPLRSLAPTKAGYVSDADKADKQKAIAAKAAKYKNESSTVAPG